MEHRLEYGRTSDALGTRKDDYAFFLRPVDVDNVPGYSDVIKHPMDLGTMATKAEKGRYRSLEEFAVCSSSILFAYV